MAFHDTRLPLAIENAMTGGPRFNTTIIALASGIEQRNINWSLSRGEWQIGYPLSRTDWQAILDFFYARQGRAHSFRFRDWSDYKIGDLEDATSYQTIGTGDGSTTAFQIVKRYTSGGTTFERDIKKPVAGVRVFLDGVEQSTPGDYSIDLLTGIITFTSAPAGSPDPDVAVICEFDVPVRFADDAFNISMRQIDLGALPDVRLLEVRGE